MRPALRELCAQARVAPGRYAAGSRLPGRGRVGPGRRAAGGRGGRVHRVGARAKTPGPADEAAEVSPAVRRRRGPRGAPEPRPQPAPEGCARRVRAAVPARGSRRCRAPWTVLRRRARPAELPAVREARPCAVGRASACPASVPAPAWRASECRLGAPGPRRFRLKRAGPPGSAGAQQLHRGLRRGVRAGQ